MLDPGSPLGVEDFWRATQLRMLPTNGTTEEMMKPPETEAMQMEELELKGENYTRNINNDQKNILAPLT